MKSTEVEIFKFQYAWIVALAVFITVASCSNDEETVIPVVPSYSDPKENLGVFHEQLMSAEYGWEGFLSPQPGKMYGLFFELNAAGKVSLYTDVDTVSAKTATETAYQIRLSQTVNPSLFFEEGSNLDRIPGTHKNSGVDKEYAFKYSHGDTLYLVGNRYGDVLRLVKATPNDSNRYKSRNLRNTMENVSGYLKSVRYLFIEPEPGRFIQFMANPISRSVYVTYMNDGANFFGSDYAYSVAGVILKNPLSTPGFGTGALLWDDAKKKLYTFYNGNQFYLKESPVPVIPLHYLLGSEYSPTFIFPTPNVESLPGWSPKFQNLWLIDDSQLWEEYGIGLFYVVADLKIEQNLMDLWVYYFNADSELMSGKFPYKLTKTKAGVFMFTPLQIDDTQEGQNAQALADRIPNILSVINNNRFRIELYDAFEEVGGLIPQFISQDDPKIYFTGYFYSE